MNEYIGRRRRRRAKRGPATQSLAQGGVRVGGWSLSSGSDGSHARRSVAMVTEKFAARGSGVEARAASRGLTGERWIIKTWDCLPDFAGA